VAALRAGPRPRFTFVPLTTLALGTVAKDRLGNATRRLQRGAQHRRLDRIALGHHISRPPQQHHQATLVGHVDVWSAETTRRLGQWSQHFGDRGADTYTASRRATACSTTNRHQAQVLAYADEFWVLSMFFFAVLIVLPLMRACARNPARAASGWRACRRRSSRRTGTGGRSALAEQSPHERPL